jgi:hypothetical protein
MHTRHHLHTPLYTPQGVKDYENSGGEFVTLKLSKTDGTSEVRRAAEQDEISAR